jgi:hypothetical protein
VCALESAVFFAHTSHRSFFDVYGIVFAAGRRDGPLQREFRMTCASIHR